MILKARKLIIGDGVTSIENGAVAIEDGKIIAIGNAKELEAKYPDKAVTDYGDATITPGLIDMHVHIGNCQTQPDMELYNQQLKGLMATHELILSLKKGVTTVRDVASDNKFCETLKIAAKKGYIQVPRILTTDRGICMSGGHGAGLSGVLEVDSPWEVRKAIRQNIREGADWIKILTSHRTFTPEYTMEELNAAVDECHRVGKKICVHAGTEPALSMCIEAGFDTIEHGTYLTVEQAKTMKEKNIAWVPTIIAYAYINELYKKQAEQMGIDHNMITPEKIEELKCELKLTRPEFDQSVFSNENVSSYAYFKNATDIYEKNLKELAETGVTILAGTDMVVYGAPVTPVAEELEYMVSFGMGTLSAIKTATSAPAKVLGLDSQIGLLKEGLFADIAIFEGDVEKDIAGLKKCKAVYVFGKKVE